MYETEKQGRRTCKNAAKRSNTREGCRILFLPVQYLKRKMHFWMAQVLHNMEDWTVNQKSTKWFYEKLLKHLIVWGQETLFWQCLLVVYNNGHYFVLKGWFGQFRKYCTIHKTVFSIYDLVLKLMANIKFKAFKNICHQYLALTLSEYETIKKYITITQLFTLIIINILKSINSLDFLVRKTISKRAIWISNNSH